MTSYRLMDGVSGRPGNGPSTANSFSSNYIAGTLFEVTQGGMWFEGYWWWVCPTGGLTAAQKCALWSIGSSGAGTLVPGSVVTSGTLSSGWNYIPLATPIQIAIGTTYTSAIAVNGNFPDTPSQFGSGDPYSAGIVNGPLTAFSDTSGTVPDPFGNAQGIYAAFGGADPSTQMPASGNSSSNLWADVQVSDTAPGGYTGSYRLWPNNFRAAAGVGGDAALPFTLATEIHFSQACEAGWVWFFSPASAASLPTWAGVYPASGTPGVTAPVLQNSSPSWRTPDGSTAATIGAGWCKCTLSGVLPAGQYKVAVYNSGGTSGSWSPYTYGYWNGVASAGITNGPVSAPGFTSATTAWINGTNGGSTPPYTNGSQEPANGTFAQDNSLVTGAPQYPYDAVDYNYSGPAGAIAESFWVDLEVTPLISGAASLTGAGSLSAADGTGSGQALSGHGALSAAVTEGVTATMQGTGALSDAAAVQLTATMQGQGAVATGAAEDVPATMQGSGQLSDASAVSSSGAITGQGSLAAAAVLGSGTTMQGTGQLAAPDVDQLAGATLTGQGAVTATGGTPGAGDATITGQGTFGPAYAQEGSLAVLAGQGQLSGTGTSQGGASAGMQGGGQLGAAAGELAAGMIAGQGQITAAATVLGPGGLPPLPDGITAGPPYGRWSAGQPHG